MDHIAIAERAVEQFRKLCIDRQIEWLETELALVSETFQYGGRLDGLLTIDGLPTVFLGDTKTSKAIYAEYLVQLAGYRQLLLENTKYKPEGFVFIHISKNLSLDNENIINLIFVPKEAIDDGWEIFKCLLIEHNLNKKMKKYLK